MVSRGGWWKHGREDGREQGHGHGHGSKGSKGMVSWFKGVKGGGDQGAWAMGMGEGRMGRPVCADPTPLVHGRYTIYKDHITLADYEIHDGMNLELYYQ